MGGATSNYEIIDTGVAQESILSPMLFNLYINDIVNSSKILSFYMHVDQGRMYRNFMGGSKPPPRKIP